MNTRCKPDSLAWISRSTEPNQIGMIVRTRQISAAWTAYLGEPVWEITFAGVVTDSNGNVLIGEGTILDAYLTPILDPSLENEVRDELKVKEPA